MSEEKYQTILSGLRSQARKVLAPEAELVAEGHRAYVARLELPNGEPAQLALYIARILRTQDLVAWQGDKAGFDRWFRQTICDYVNNCYGRIEPREGKGGGQ